MATGRKKFNFGGSSLNTRESEIASEVPAVENRAQELVNAIENAGVNTAFNFKLIPRQKLIFHEENDYPMEAIKELAESILNNGLLHNLDVHFDEENDIYIIEAGEQRTRAIDLLIEKFRDYSDKDSEEYQKYSINVQPFEKGYPCKVCTGTSRMKISEGLDEDSLKELDMIESRLRLRISNEIGREYDPARTKKALDDIVNLENRRNELLRRDKKLTNKEIGAQPNISDRMVQKYKSIDRLIPELQELFQERGITLTDGANYANLNKNEQLQILELINAGGNKKEIAELYAQLSRVKNEMKQKEKELEKLEKEKTAAEEKVAQANEAADKLREQIHEELQREFDTENKAERKKVEELQAQLLLANQNVKEYEKQKVELSARCEEIAQLKKALEEKNTAGNSAGASVAIKAGFRVESGIKGIEAAFQELQKAIADYQKVYDSDVCEKTLENYQDEIKKCIKKWEKECF